MSARIALLPARQRCAITSALGRLRSACTSLGSRGVYWDECTAEAEPLRRQAENAKRRLADAGSRLHSAAHGRRLGRRGVLRDSLDDVESAWRDAESVYALWAYGYGPDDPVGSVLSAGAGALSDLQHAVEAAS